MLQVEMSNICRSKEGEVKKGNEKKEFQRIEIRALLQYKSLVYHISGAQIPRLGKCSELS